MRWSEVVAHVLVLAHELPPAAWHDHESPLLRWDVATLTCGDYWVEVVHQRYGDYWRVRVFAASQSRWGMPLFRAEGPLFACVVMQVTPGPWYAAVMTATPLRVGLPTERQAG